MSKDLHHTILEFFVERMRNHSNVRDVADVSSDEFYLYRVHRTRQSDSVLVWLSDAYRFTDMDYYNRPPELSPGDFILVARPEAGAQVTSELVDEARIGVGKLGELMGALNRRDMWTYRPPNWDEKKRVSERFRAWREKTFR